MATTTPDSAIQSAKDRKTSMLVRFTAAPDVTAEQYDETMRRLVQAGDWMPDGLDYHVAFRSKGQFRVTEIWDSQKQLDAFSERLMPVLKDVGIELAGEPEVLEIYKTVKR